MRREFAVEVVQHALKVLLVHVRHRVGLVTAEARDGEVVKVKLQLGDIGSGVGVVVVVQGMRVRVVVRRVLVRGRCEKVPRRKRCGLRQVA